MMKKILASAFFIGFSISLFAQTFDLGIKGGINSSKIITSNSSPRNYTLSDLRSDAKMGYNIGAFARLGGKRLYLQPEVLYTVKKADNQMNLTGNSEFGVINASSQSFNLKSVQVPLLLGCKLINLKLFSLRAFTGPAMSVILDNSEIKLTGSGSITVDPQVYDPKYFKNNVWDWQAGGGIDIGNLVFDVRYEWGLSNVSDFNTQKISFNNKGNTFTFSVGFKFL